MEDLVVFSVIAASLLHASWHALIKSTGDRVVSLGGMSVVSVGTALALIPLTTPLPAVVFWIMTGSAVLHFSYKITLARLYREADLGQAYPLARGLTPLIATAIAFFAIGEAPDSLAITGIGLVCCGLALLAFEGHGQGVSIFTFGVALATGLTVACYSVVDAYGIRITGDAFSYTVLAPSSRGGELRFRLETAVDRLAQQGQQAVLLVLPEARILKAFCAHRSQPECLIEFAIRQQPGIRGDLAAQKFQLQSTVETDPQILVLAVTHWVPRSAWHELAEHPCF